MTRRTLLLAPLAAGLARGAARMRALIIDGQNNHKTWPQTTPLLRRWLEETGLFAVDVATTPPEGQDNSAFAPSFADYRVVVSNYNGDAWPAKTQRAFEEYVRSGGGFVSVHAADNAFPDWEAYNEMIGVGGWGGRSQASGPYLRMRNGKWVRDEATPGTGGHHGDRHAFTVEIQNPSHPITKGLPARWRHAEDELYDQLRGPAKNVEVLASAFSSPSTRGTGEQEPMLMTIAFGKGRVFHTTLGHSPEAMHCVGFIATFQRGAEWAATGKVTQAVPPDFPGDEAVSLRSLAARSDAARSRAANRRIALTIDDLPMAQSGPQACRPEILMPATKRLLEHFAAEKAPLTAFVVTSQCPSLTVDEKRAALQLWLDAGVELGNHTHSHQSLTSTPIDQYEQDILKANGLLREWTGKPVRFFRWPMLHAGATPEVKQRLEKFLAAHDLREAPVTFDNSDWIFANVFAYAQRTGDKALEKRVLEAYVPYMEQVLAFFEERSKKLLGREIPQVLLMHANLLNAEAGGELLRMLRRRGYEFISLEEALADEAYELPNDYAASKGISWLHRWGATRGEKIQLEPDAPKWVMQKLEEITKP